MKEKKLKRNFEKNGKKSAETEPIPAPTSKAKNLYGQPTMCDPLGSYTGQPIDKYEMPVQDVDDL